MTTSLSYFWKKKTLLSFVAVFFVIIIHNSATKLYPPAMDTVSNLALGLRNFLAYDLGAVAVPLFFFLSGFALFRNFSFKQYGRKMRSRTKSLLIPYLFWNIFGMAVIILCTFTPLAKLVMGRELFNLSLHNFLEGIFLYKYNFQFWFMYDLIIYVVLTPVIYLLIRNKYLGGLAVMMALMLPLFTESFAFLNLNFTIFYVLGCFAGKHCLAHFTKPKSCRSALLAGLVAVTILIIRFLAIYEVIMLPIIVTQLLLVLLMLSLWFFADLFVPRLKNKKYTAEFFPVYVLHTYFLAVFAKLIFFALPKNSYALLVNEILSPIMTLVVVTTLSYWWHQKLNKSYNLLFGNRKD